ncbi:MAG: TIGR04283 family arsenosugar biosynthesis glycosyltransferase [Candidatus Omnitrophica bacterium]|nr:TIGR04283 family arsenosugar biosynthesis glycosyltransferase [Candidatus Omnitrophota bacterium]
MKISVIIPALNEETTINATLDDLFTHHKPEEVIVVDGGSADQTILKASSRVKVILSQKGRARQMNAGAQNASGDVLLFLHADTLLPKSGLETIRQQVLRGVEAGRFRMRFSDRDWLSRIFESYTRFHFFSYGDQGFFVIKEIFQKLEGFDEQVPFEDIDFYKRLRKLTQPVIIEDAVITSSRRFQGTGRLRQKFINLFLVGLYYLGFDVFKFKAKLYPEVR